MGTTDKDLSLYDEKPLQDNEMDDMAYESESESEEEDAKLSIPSQNAIYNRDGLNDKLQDISWPEDVGWIHKLSVDIDQEQEVDAFEKLESMGLPFLRPPDYYAEMVKSDAHMEKVKGRLLAEKRNIEESEERRKAREAKRLAKEVQTQKLKERAMQKKMDIETVKKWRKQRQQSGFARGDKDGEMNLSFEDGNVFERPSKKRPGVSPGDRLEGKQNKIGKREAKKDWRSNR
ncbi:hypothetical protein GH714_026535 [Hevea brasiliensis]|uniref:Uncharacterized protein n=1 Tax=Hevea brasiliensis TaxID=3981 RepID=A0A6A6MFR5_HEVBR|nr:hypothetical protein GH714_026535 [Hevea brasiliensis]